MLRLVLVMAALLLPVAARAQTACGSVTHSIVSLDVSTITTGGTAVTALNAGHAVCGGFIVTSNSAGICVNQKGTAGTASSGDTACVAANVPYYLAPSKLAVSVNSTASSVALAGNGYSN